MIWSTDTVLYSVLCTTLYRVPHRATKASLKSQNINLRAKYCTRFLIAPTLAFVCHTWRSTFIDSEALNWLNFYNFTARVVHESYKTRESCISLYMFALYSVDWNPTCAHAQALRRHCTARTPMPMPDYKHEPMQSMKHCKDRWSLSLFASFASLLVDLLAQNYDLIVSRNAINIFALNMKQKKSIFSPNNWFEELIDYSNADWNDFCQQKPVI